MRVLRNPGVSAFVFQLVFSLVLGACTKKPEASRERAVQVQREMKELIARDLDAWLDASRALAAAAPLPRGRGWDAHEDAAAIATMKQAWRRGRAAYERSFGAIAPLFPESEITTGARYDDLLTTLGPAGDANAFDGEGVTGMHAIERVLWADAMPAEVVALEQGLPGYRAAAFPANEAEARAFKEQLAGRLVLDIAALRTQLAALDLDVAFVFHALIDLETEQAEKLERAAAGLEESRYAQSTLADLRKNHEGCLAAYALFRPWLRESPRGPELDARVSAAFERLRASYDAIAGDAVPPRPAGFRRLEPSRAHLATPFGQLFSRVGEESDQAVAGSLRAELGHVAGTLHLPGLVTR